MRIDANGQPTLLGEISGTEGGDLWAGEFSPKGEYVITGANSKVFRVDVNGANPTVIGSAEKYYSNGTGTGTPVFGDITFDAVSGQCYGFDISTKKMAILDPITGAVNAFGVQRDDIPVVGAITSDVQGNLYGFVLDKIYQIDKSSGILNYLINGPDNEGGIDATTCPYFLDLMKTVSKENACAGDTLVYTFQLFNSSQHELQGIGFVDSLPAPLNLISNPSDLFGGFLSNNSGQGFSQVEITNMTIPTGLSSFYIKANVPDNLSQQMYLLNQARIHGLPSGLPSEILSDDAATFYLDDPTVVCISPPIHYEIDIQNSSPLCPGDSLSLQATSLEDGTYQWNGPNGFLGEKAIATISDLRHSNEGRYHLHFTNNLGCRLDTFTDVSLFPNPMPFLGADTSHCLKTPYNLYPGDFNKYQWQDGSTKDNFSVEEYGTFGVTVTNEFGCVGSDSVFISDGCLPHLYVPNAFSPNHDGINDKFYAYAFQVVQFQMQVFDRWGELVFKNDDINRGWDGIFRGSPMPTGIYAYLIEATFLNGQSLTESGGVLLIR